MFFFTYFNSQLKNELRPEIFLQKSLNMLSPTAIPLLPPKPLPLPLHILLLYTNDLTYELGMLHQLCFRRKCYFCPLKFPKIEFQPGL